ncbi:MAG: prepilin peptidase [Lachnospiraceae bacterium]|nr:prepilin peptidase [Lachnospiraceae bacterium]MBQ3905161.1 prepilin peptidase [Lachnospiraceae bacterium]
MMGEVFFVLSFCALLCVACIFDYGFMKIPNWLILVLLALGLAHALWGGAVADALSFFLRGGAVLLALYPLFRIGTMGGGDVKLFAVLGAALPKGKILSFLFFSLLFAAIFSLFRFLRRSDLKERFSYLCAYVKGVARSGEWTLYFHDLEEKRRAGICMAGPILLSVLLYFGGFY